MTLVRYETHEGVAVITVDNPPVNALSPGVPGGIIAGLKHANTDPDIVAVVLVGGRSGFYRRCRYTLFLETLARR